MVFKLPDFNCIRMTSETPGKASVLFYQTDEEIESRVRPEHLNEQVEDNVRRIRQKSSLKLKMFSIRSESEDSGVRCNDDEENIRALSGRRKSRVSLYSISSSPAFEISTFDELFQTGGQTRLYLNKAPSILFRQQSNRRQSTIDPPLEEHSEPDLESEKTETPQESRNEFKRQDSVMSQTLTSLINTSWQGSKGFQEYRHRVGNAVHHKYCMCCRIESTLFIFLYVIFGIFLICTGIMCSLDCGEEFMLTAYLISDGLLSVFLFPTIILGWTNRIGGCFNERESDNNGLFWAVILTLRVIFAGAGTFIVYHRYIQDLPWDNSVCYIEFIILVSTVAIEWSFLLFVILVPLCICGVTFICASSYCADTD